MVEETTTTSLGAGRYFVVCLYCLSGRLQNTQELHRILFTVDNAVLCIYHTVDAGRRWPFCSPFPAQLKVGCSTDMGHSVSFSLSCIIITDIKISNMPPLSDSVSASVTIHSKTSIPSQRHTSSAISTQNFRSSRCKRNPQMDGSAMTVTPRRSWQSIRYAASATIKDADIANISL
jgi:hypothetical protein